MVDTPLEDWEDKESKGSWNITLPKEMDRGKALI
jgi:hypothetical protein